MTGAAGNMGSHMSRHLMTTRHQMRLLIHKSPLPFDIVNHSNIEVCRADLGEPKSLQEVCASVVSFTLPGFCSRRFERFLPKTNVDYVKNFVSAASDAG